MNIKQWPKTERPRERMTQFGAENLSDAELLAILLRTGIRGKTAVDLARDLLQQFGSLKKLLQADLNTLCQCKGLGMTKYIELQAALEIARRNRVSELKRGQSITDPQAAQTFLSDRLKDLPNEVFSALFLDSKHRVLSFNILFYGSIDQATVYPREVVRRVLENNAAAVIFAHNHPSGNPIPSTSDFKLTKSLCQVMECIQVQVLDHFVIGQEGYYSFAENDQL